MAFFSRGFRAVCVFRGEMSVFILVDDYELVHDVRRKVPSLPSVQQ